MQMLTSSYPWSSILSHFVGGFSAFTLSTGQVFSQVPIIADHNFSLESIIFGKTIPINDYTQWLEEKAELDLVDKNKS